MTGIPLGRIFISQAAIEMNPQHIDQIMEVVFKGFDIFTGVPSYAKQYRHTLKAFEFIGLSNYFEPTLLPRGGLYDYHDAKVPLYSIDLQHDQGGELKVVAVRKQPESWWPSIRPQMKMDKAGDWIPEQPHIPPVRVDSQDRDPRQIRNFIMEGINGEQLVIPSIRDVIGGDIAGQPDLAVPRNEEERQFQDMFRTVMQEINRIHRAPYPPPPSNPEPPSISFDEATSPMTATEVDRRNQEMAMGGLVNRGRNGMQEAMRNGIEALRRSLRM